MKKTNSVKLGDANLIEISDGTYMANVELDGADFEILTQGILSGLNFILKTITVYRKKNKIEAKGNALRDLYKLSFDTAEDGYYVIEATAQKSKFTLCTSSMDDCKKVLKAIDLRFPRNPLREFIGEAARKSLKSFNTNSV